MEELPIKYMNEIIKADNPLRHTVNAYILSEIDTSKRIDNSTWVVSLVRNSEFHGSNEHTLIILEGKDGEKAKTYFMDFVAARVADMWFPGFRPGKIRFYVKEGSLTDALVYSCPLKYMDLVLHQRISSYSCSLDRALCENLKENVLSASSAAVQPQYNILGCDSLFAHSSAWSSSNDVGHSCFSWACQQLKELNDPRLMETMPQLSNTGPLRFIIMIPSIALRKETRLKSDIHRRVPYEDYIQDLLAHQMIGTLIILTIYLFTNWEFGLWHYVMFIAAIAMVIYYKIKDIKL